MYQIRHFLVYLVLSTTTAHTMTYLKLNVITGIINRSNKLQENIIFTYKVDYNGTILFFKISLLIEKLEIKVIHKEAIMLIFSCSYYPKKRLLKTIRWAYMQYFWMTVFALGITPYIKMFQWGQCLS